MPIPDFSKIRGLNYYSSWAANSIGQWRFYDAVQAEKELGYLASIGCNSVRTTLNFAVWEEEGQGFLDNLTDFLTRTANHGISVILNIWDSVGMEPSATPYDDLQKWTSTPGSSKVADPAFLPQGDAYVTAVVQAAMTTQAVVVWDIMNEADNQPVAWTQHYLNLVKQIDPASTTTVGYFFAKSNALTADLVDVLSYHPYGVFRANVTVPTQQARDIAADHGNKPILATELGFPGGGGQRYEDVLDYITQEGVGFYLFQAMIGDNPSFSWKTSTGFFYKDGTVRDITAVRAFQSVSKAQGFPLSTFPLLKDESDPLWIPYAPVPDDFGAPEAANLLVNFDQHYGVDFPLVQDDLPFYQALVSWAFASLWLAEVITTADLEEPEDLSDQLATSAAAGQWAAAETALKDAVSIAAGHIQEHSLAEPLNASKPEILASSVTPNPFTEGDQVRIEMIAWHPDGLPNVVLTAALGFKASGGPFVFSLPLGHEGSGIYAFKTGQLGSVATATSYDVLFVAGDPQNMIDVVWPFSVSATLPTNPKPDS